MLFKIQLTGIKSVYLWSTRGNKYVKEIFQGIHPRLTGWRWVRGRPFNCWGGGGGWFWKKFPASACRKKKIACSTNVIEGLWEKKGKKYPAHQIARKKKSWWPEITHPSPQELNGRHFNISYDVNRRFPNFFDNIFGWLGPDPTQLVLCTAYVSFLADFIASWKTVH